MSQESVWEYPRPPKVEPTTKRIRVAFYVGRVDACYVDEERAQAQPGGFYGGWVTSDIIGPFKGRPGSETW
jgi:hypothetical protein